MANEILVKKSLILSVEEGIDEDGKPIVKRYTYSNIRKAATPDELVAGAAALASLYEGTASYSTVNTNDLF
jgi:hypothetical protein